MPTGSPPPVNPRGHDQIREPAHVGEAHGRGSVEIRWTVDESRTRRRGRIDDGVEVFLVHQAFHQGADQRERVLAHCDVA